MAVGQHYFAYADAGEAFDPDVHNVWDESIFSYEYVWAEGDFAGIDFVIRNPRIGLLNASRKKYAWFSMETAPGVLTPIFYGRIVGVPDNIFEELVTVSYTARPVDYIDQKEAVADGLRVAPYWDPLLIHPDKVTDPDVVLEGYSKVWNIDPVTHVVTVSDVINGEDGTIEITTPMMEGFECRMGESPASRCIATVAVPFINYSKTGINGTGPINIMGEIGPLFPGTGGLIRSYTFQGLKDSWPTPNTQIRGGYTVGAGTMLEDLSLLVEPAEEVKEYYFLDFTNRPVPKGSFVFKPKISGKFTSGETASFSSSLELVVAPLGVGRGHFNVTWEASREYTEVVTINMTADIQPIVTDPGDDDIIRIEITANKASDLIDGSVPVGNVLRRTFLNQSRGLQLLKAVVAMMRAQLIIKARAVEISFKLPVIQALNLAFTLRKNVLVHNPRLPGAQAVGKIKNIAMSLDGETGRALATITIGCAIGKGGSYTSVPGDPVYGSTDYMGADYQQFTNTIHLIEPSLDDIAFTVENYVPDDDGIDLANLRSGDQIIRNVTVFDHHLDQRALLEPLAHEIGDQAVVSAILQEHPTRVQAEFVNLNSGPFETQVVVNVQPLVIAAQINLEAASV